MRCLPFLKEMEMPKRLCRHCEKLKDIKEFTFIFNDHLQDRKGEWIKSFVCEKCAKKMGIRIWQYTNIYNSALIGRNCSIGCFCEIGKDVVIGDNVRIGAYTFIPEGVTIEDDVFIAPKVCFVNDKFPPSHGKSWEKTLIKKGAVIGANSTILPIVIGERALIGAGSVVTKDIPPDEVWCGCPAKFLRKR